MTIERYPGELQGLVDYYVEVAKLPFPEACRKAEDLLVMIRFSEKESMALAAQACRKPTMASRVKP